MVTNSNTIWQERVVAEKHELDIRISKLQHYVNSSHTPGEMIQLSRQLAVMLEYSDILKDRIYNFRDDN